MGIPFSNIIICDDHSVCRMGVKTALNELYSSQGLALREAVDGTEALNLAKAKVPDLAIIDLGLPGISGLKLIPLLHELSIKMKILVLTSNDNPLVLNQVLRSRVNGILLKNYSMELIGEVLQHIVAHPNTPFLDPQVKLILEKTDKASLTKREFEVLELLIKGNTNKEIADILECSTETVKTHRTHIMEKTQTRNRSELTAWYLQGQGEGNSGSDV